MPIFVSDPNLQNDKDADKYLDMWKKLWSVRDTAWHLENRHPVLVKYNNLLTGDENSSNKKRILFPLCGKNVDMKWFWERGHQVFGVECADEAINDFFTLNNISFTSSSSNNSIDGTVFKTDDEGLQIIQTNFLTLDSPILNNTIDAVWDRGSFGTITYEEQVLYAQTMKRLLGPDFRYLLLVLEFDENVFKGPPFSVSENRIQELMGDFCNIQKLESTLPQHLQLYQKHMGEPLEVRETVYLMTAKS